MPFELYIYSYLNHTENGWKLKGFERLSSHEKGIRRVIYLGDLQKLTNSNSILQVMAWNKLKVNMYTFCIDNFGFCNNVTLWNKLIFVRYVILYFIIN